MSVEYSVSFDDHYFRFTWKKGEFLPIPKHLDKYVIHGIDGMIGPVGLMSETIMSLETEDSSGIPSSFTDQRDSIRYIDRYREPLPFPKKVLLDNGYSYSLTYAQVEAINHCLSNPQAVVEMPTGSGKTLVQCFLADRLMETICAYPDLFDNSNKILYVVDSIDLKAQAYKSLMDYLGRTYSVGHKHQLLSTNPYIIVETIQSLLARVTKGLNNVSAIIFDEVHLAGAKSYYNLLKACPNAIFRYGFTGTYERTANNYIDLMASVGPLTLIITPEETKATGLVPEAEIIMIEVPSEEIKRKVVAEYAWTCITQGKKLLAMVTLIKDQESYRDLFKQNCIPDEYIATLSGDNSKQERQDALKRLENGDLRLLLATKIFEKGVNIPVLDGAINLKGEGTKIGTLQSLGRILRGGNKKIYIDFIDQQNPKAEGVSYQRYSMYTKQNLLPVRILSVGDFLDEFTGF